MRLYFGRASDIFQNILNRIPARVCVPLFEQYIIFERRRSYFSGNERGFVGGKPGNIYLFIYIRRGLGHNDVLLYQGYGYGADRPRNAVFLIWDHFADNCGYDRIEYNDKCIPDYWACPFVSVFLYRKPASR